MRPHPSSFAFLISAALLVTPHPLEPLEASQTGAVSVSPGSVAVWAGEGITRCEMKGETWRPLDGACYYPVDLLAEGSVRVGRTVSGAREERLLEIAPYPFPSQRIDLPNDEHVRLSKANLARAAREAKEVGKLFSLRGPASFDLPLGPPLAPLPEPRNFGSRRLFNGEPRSPHGGADFSAGRGTPVHAVAPGRVVLAKSHFFSGNSVFVDHGDGLISMYFHLDETRVREGARIAKGEVLGTVGATGRASGPHLHLGFRWKGARVNPEALLDRRGLTTL